MNGKSGRCVLVSDVSFYSFVLSIGSMGETATITGCRRDVYHIRCGLLGVCLERKVFLAGAGWF